MENELTPAQIASEKLELNDVIVAEKLENIEEVQCEMERNNSLLNDWIEAKKEFVERKNASMQEYIDAELDNIKNYVKMNENKKETKTQFSLTFLDKKVVVKKANKKIVNPNIKVNKDNAEIIANTYGKDYVEKSDAYKFKWDALKKNLKIDGDKVVNIQTGEIVDGIEVEDVPEEVLVK